MLGCRDDPLVRFPVISIERRVPPINRGHLLPYFPGATPGAVTDVKGNDLFRGRVNRQPDPLLVGLELDETPYLIGLGVRPEEFDVPPATGRQLHTQIIRQRLIERSDEIEQPAQADVHHPADAEQRKTLKQEAANLCALRFSDALRVGHELSPAVLTLMVLFAGVSMAILLE